MQGILSAAREAICDFLDTRLEWWNAQKEHELVHAKFTNPDSYYIYHLLRLIGAKDDAVLESIAKVKTEWDEHAATELEELSNF